MEKLIGNKNNKRNNHPFDKNKKNKNMEIDENIKNKNKKIKFENKEKDEENIINDLCIKNIHEYFS